jgi:RimJ/RimL family protein N-acetyltransferase
MQTEPLVGPAVSGKKAALPGRVILRGSHIIVSSLCFAEHAASLWALTGGAAHEALWRYMGEGPFSSREIFNEMLRKREVSLDPVFYALVEPGSRQALGMAALMRIEPDNRVIEVGNILYSDVLQKTRAATEAMYLLARYVFEELGYRRYEWKCNALNEPSRKAALRLGFTFEGIFRQHMVVKGRNRDTAWFSMLDSEWPNRKARFEHWLSPSNFDAHGHQNQALGQAGE